jgi:hypothetical protein
MNNHFITRFLLFTFICVILLSACNPRIGYLENLMQAELDELCNKHNLPGMTASFMLGNGTIVTVASGLADKEYNIQMTPQSRMLAASIGKSFVAATCVALALIIKNRDMYVLFGPFDLIISLLLILFNVFVFKTDFIKRFNWKLVTILFILFLVVIPVFSAEIERTLVFKQHEIVDSFNLLYIIFRFPVWWILGLFEFIMIKLIFRHKRKNTIAC